MITRTLIGPFSQVYKAEPASVPAARAWVRHTLAPYPSPVDPDVVGLAVSELVTNAVIHGPGGVVAVLWAHWHDGIRLVVGDGGGNGAPRLLESTPGSEGGRGLHVVDMLSEQWGTFSDGGPRIVWCDLGSYLTGAESLAWAWFHAALAKLDLREGPCHTAGRYLDMA